MLTVGQRVQSAGVNSNATAPSRDGENLGHEHCSWQGALDEVASRTARDAVVEGIRPDAAVDAVEPTWPPMPQ